MTDLSAVKYDVLLSLDNPESSSNKLVLNEFLTSVSWEESETQLAAKAILILHNTKSYQKGSNYEISPQSPLSSLIRPGSNIIIKADWGHGYEEVFAGNVWNWERKSSKDGELLTVTAYDPLIRLQQSRDHFNFSAGRSTKAVLNDICSKWGIGLDYSYADITHTKLMIRNATLNSIIFGILEAVRRQTGERFVTGFKNKSLVVRRIGYNSDVYVFDANTLSTTHLVSLNKLITKVTIIGASLIETSKPVEATITGDTTFGVLQDIIVRPSTQTLAEAKAEAQTIIDDFGKPIEKINFLCADLPAIKKGHKIKLNAGGLYGYFFVSAVSHNGNSMSIEAEK